MSSGLCECGCGEPAPIAASSHQRRGYVKGKPHRFIRDHYDPTTPPVERFWPRVDRRGPDECWLWTGGVAGRYGQLARKGRERIAAHRLAWELEFGPIPKGLFVCHRCDVPLCCNPAHLFLGTPADNMADKIAKGRHGALQGERAPGAKLNAGQVHEIRELASGGQRHRDLARRFGVNPSAISLVVNRKTWAGI